MSRAPPDNFYITETDIGPDAGTLLPLRSSLPFSPAIPIGDCQYPPRSARNQAWHGESNFVDSSGPIFSMYMEMAEEEDKKMAESWKADAEGILVFVRYYLLVLCVTLTLSRRLVYSRLPSLR
jgi:hypothetical protein